MRLLVFWCSLSSTSEHLLVVHDSTIKNPVKGGEASNRQVSSVSLAHQQADQEEIACPTAVNKFPSVSVTGEHSQTVLH